MPAEKEGQPLRRHQPPIWRQVPVEKMSQDASTRYSPSKLDTYKNCPRQYKYHYIDKIQREEQSVEAFLGSCVHEALEKLYEGVRHGKILTREEVLAAYDAAWRRAVKEPIVIRNKEYSLDDWRAVGGDCVQTYYDQFYPFDQDKTVAVEGRIGFPLEIKHSEAGETMRVRMEGFIDRLAMAPDGAFEIHDYKTSKTLPTQADQDEDWQLAIYNVGVLDAWPDAAQSPPVRLKWHYLRHGVTITSTRAPEQLRKLKEDIAELILAIKRDPVFEPRKSALCDWCDYRDICPLWKHAEVVGSLPEKERCEENGVRLADQYAELEKKKKLLSGEIRAIESEQEELEHRIIRYADEHEITALEGTDCRLDIYAREEFKFPTRSQSPEQIEHIESELKKTSIWFKVSRLDTRTLMEGFKARKWPRDVLQLIEGWIDRLIHHEMTRVIRVHKKKESDLG